MLKKYEFLKDKLFKGIKELWKLGEKKKRKEERKRERDSGKENDSRGDKPRINSGRKLIF